MALWVVGLCIAGLLGLAVVAWFVVAMARSAGRMDDRMGLK